MSHSVGSSDNTKHNLSMDKSVEKELSLFNYWYFRYMLVTELFMVEKWERIFIHVFLLILFVIFGIFNYKVLLPMTTRLFIYQ